MNRRQFLGRFFQAVISAHNSKSTYGIYHPWRQYNSFLQNVVINLYYTYVDETGVTRNMAIPYMSRTNTIIAVYDSNNTMIYCSAYKYNGGIRNNLDTTIYLYNMPSGAYTIKCLQYGIGLCESDDGNEITFVVPDVPDRSTLPYNNYGYISVPAVSVNYIFGIAGIYFTAESGIETIGTYFFENPNIGAWKIECKAPTYEECKALYETTAVNAGLSKMYSKTLYLQDVMENYSPLTDEYWIRLGDRYQLHSIIKAVFVNNGTETEVATIDLKDYNNTGATAAAEYWKVCDYNGLEYNPEVYYQNNDGIGWYTQISGISSTDGSYEVYTCAGGVSGLLNPTKDSNSIVAGGSNVYNGISNITTEFNYQISNVNISITSTYPRAYINNQQYYGSSMMWIKVRTEMNIDRWMYGNSELRKEIVERGAVIKDTIQELYEDGLPKLAAIRDKFYNDYWVAAFEHYHEDPNNNVPWIKAETVSHEYTYPISALFGKLTADKSIYPVIPPPTSGDIPELFATVREPYVNLHWGLDAYKYKQTELDAKRRKLQPMLAGYTADLSEYDPNGECNNSSMWISFNNHAVFLRQNLIEVDMGAIPDHQITH